MYQKIFIGSFFPFLYNLRKCLLYKNRIYFTNKVVFYRDFSWVKEGVGDEFNSLNFIS